MFNIDLLKGEGLPEKGKAKTMAIVAFASAVPVVVAIAMFGLYLHNRISTSIISGETERWKAKTGKLSDAVAKQDKLERERDTYGACLADVETAINKHTQWSPILAEVVGAMPESTVLTSMEVKQRVVRMKVPTKEDPQKTKDVSVPVPILKMNVAATPQSDGDKDVRNFRNKLLASASLGSKIENITVSQKANKLNDLEVVSYEINCIFKPKL